MTRPLALVTGGARRLGGAIAAALARAGYDLAIHGRHPPEPEPALAEAIDAGGAAWRPFVADLADGTATLALIPAIEAAFGRPPALIVNNASLFAEDRPEDVKHDALLAAYAVNCASPVLLARELAARGGGVVVNVLDQRVVSPPGDQFAYTLGKAALTHATAILARELAPSTRVCAVAPGLTLPGHDWADGRMEALAGLMPLGRLPDPAAVADAVLYLARAKAVTGQTLFVDAGAHLRHYARDFAYLDPASLHGPSSEITSA